MDGRVVLRHEKSWSETAGWSRQVMKRRGRIMSRQAGGVWLVTAEHEAKC